MRKEINLITCMATLPISFRWEMLIRHVIPMHCDYVVMGDVYFTGCGACCLEIKFWHCVQCPHSFVHRTLNHVKKRHLELIAISILEHATTMLSHNDVIDGISNPNTQHPPETKYPSHVENAIVEY